MRRTRTATAEAIVLDGYYEVLLKGTGGERSHLQPGQAGGTVEEESGYRVWVHDSDLGEDA
jgi:hypothetical protein